MCVCVGVCAHECGAYSGQKRALDLLGLELQGIVNCLIWVLEPKCGSSA